MEFNGKIKKLYFHNSKNNWCSARIVLEDETEITAAGIIVNPIEGYNIKIFGNFVVDSKYGKQIAIESATTSAPENKEGIIRVLATYDGIGPATAIKIFNEFGLKSLKIVKKTPEKLIIVPGITEKKIENIKNSNAINDTVVELISITNGKISPLQAAKIVNKYKGAAVKLIKENPYRLSTDFKGIGFKIADQYAKSLGISLTSRERIYAAMIYILHEQSEKNGHMYVTAALLQEEILKLISDFSNFSFKDKRKENAFGKLMTEKIQDYMEDPAKYNEKYNFSEFEFKCINQWIEIVNSVIDTLADIITKAEDSFDIFVDEDMNIYYRNSYNAEYYTAKSLAYLASLSSIKTFTSEEIDKKIEKAEKENGYPLGIEQKNAIKNSVNSRVSIITGGPGRGKTTIIQTIIEIWNDWNNIILCAPTGRAAQRMKEQTGHEASTIHSLIFKHSYPPLTKKLFIVDESSMIDIKLASQLLSIIINGDNNVIFVGDADQLPSVGAGNFLNDIISSKVIVTSLLTTSYRNFGNIANNAALINVGKTFSKMSFGSDFFFTECDHEILQKNIIDLYEKLLKEYEPKDICILSPMRTRSSSGTNTMNELIREKFNPLKDNSYKDYPFRPNDRVMCIKNNASKEMLSSTGLNVNGVFNGDCGTIVETDFDTNDTKILFDDGKIGNFSLQELKTSFVLAYAITIHKSQGSEYKSVILAITTEHFVMLQRNLLYTAITRAKTRVDVLGMQKAFNMAVRNTDYKARNSNLKPILISTLNDLSNDYISSNSLKEHLLNFYKDLEELKSKTIYESDDDES